MMRDEVPNYFGRIERAIEVCDYNAALEQLEEAWRLLTVVSSARGLPLGWRLPDMLAERLAMRVAREITLYDSSSVRENSDLYIASNLYAAGGHTALLGDYIEALRPRRACVLVTNFRGAQSRPLEPEITARLHLDGEEIDVATDELSHFDRLNWLCERIAHHRPQRLFLFNHPDDVLAAVAATLVPAKAHLIHHADGVFSCGLTTPQFHIIELTPGTAQWSELAGANYSIVEMTAADPGEHPTQAKGNLVTASCGTEWKYRLPAPFNYSELVVEILKVTHGHHLHIGPISSEFRHGILEKMKQAQISADRFRQIDWTDNMAKTLWAEGVGLYLPSMPVGGARTSLDVMSAAIPQLWFGVDKASLLHSAYARYPRAKCCLTLEEIIEAVRDATPQWLAAQARSSRRFYLKRFHPAKFRRRLQAALARSEAPKTRRKPSEATIRLLRQLPRQLFADILRQTQIDKLASQVQQLQKQLEDIITAKST